jgi:transposase
MAGGAVLGPPKARRLDRPVLASLDQLVPPDHFYRRLEAKLDLAVVREWVGAKYAEGGRPSIDPVVFLKLQLILFFEGLRSERKLIETANLHLAHRWYLGYALDEPLPDHSSLTRIRARSRECPPRLVHVRAAGWRLPSLAARAQTRDQLRVIEDEVAGYGVGFLRHGPAPVFVGRRITGGAVGLGRDETGQVSSSVSATQAVSGPLRRR